MKSARRSATILEATASYEAWLGEQVRLIPEDLDRKHVAMRAAPFPFLRATYYRWVQLWPQVCKHLRGAREVLAVGDLHVENFGTWRDAEGRLAWGINDFDECWRLPYTNDLVRLAVSARLAISGGDLALDAGAADAALLAGYREGLEAGGRAIVLAEQWAPLRKMATEAFKNPETFWQKLDALPPLDAHRVPAGAAKALASALPAEDLPRRHAHRIAGLGSLGRERVVAVADWCGGKIAREAKALAPSACVWAHRGAGEPRDLYRALLAGAVRSRDPFVAVKRRWIVRRLAPDCSRIELSQLPQEKDAGRLLHAMGWETANVHIGSASAHALLLDLVSRPHGWLSDAAQQMLAVVLDDWETWRGSAAEENPAPPSMPEEAPGAAAPAPARRKAPKRRT
jgi:uncharacterized protein DUF2252